MTAIPKTSPATAVVLPARPEEGRAFLGRVPWARRGVVRARCTEIPSASRHAVHAYQGVNPWSADGSQLLYLGFEELGQAASLVVRDMGSGRETRLAESLGYDFHTAASQRWVLRDSAVLFRTRNGTREPALAMARVDRPGAAEVLHEFAGRMARHICADTRHAITASLRGVERLDLQARTSEILVPMEEIMAALPAELKFPGQPFHIEHPITSPDETRLFFKLGHRDPARLYGSRNWGAFFAKNLARGGMRCFGNRISGHPSWMPDSRHILNVMMPDDGSDNRWLVLMDVDTGSVERLMDLPIEGAGHPAVSPDGRWIATDGYSVDGRSAPVYLVDLASGNVREIARIPHHILTAAELHYSWAKGGAVYDPSVIRRSHLHPVWSPDSRRLLVNCNHDGERMGLVLLEDFLGENPPGSE